MLAASLITLGSPAQLTGGYLYHQRLAEAAPAHGARLDFVSFPMLPFPLAALWGPAVLRRASRGADVVVVDSIAAGFLGPVMAVRPTGGTPVVAMVHQPPGGIDHGPLRARARAFLDRAVYRRAALVLAASQDLSDDFTAEGFGEKMRVVAPGCDLADPPEGPLPDLRQGRKAALLSVGNWVARKGTLTLLDAFAPLPPDAATLHLVGRTDVARAYAERVRNRLAAPDLVGRVVVHGPRSRPEVAAFYRAADVFVLPSEREPYGTVYGEAMAAGLPVVGWRAGNLPHLAQDGVEGLILSPGDVPGLSAALGRLSGDEALRHRLSEGARRRGRSLPTWAETGERFFTLLREVAGRPAGTAG
ncbi:MAG: glycosyltransferase family 4 protein [Acidimicrobiales bacterium]